MTELRERVITECYKRADLRPHQARPYIDGWQDCFEYLQDAGATQSVYLVETLKELKRAEVRMGILVARMRGCNEKTGQHELINESQAYVDETRECIAKIEAAIKEGEK